MSIYLPSIRSGFKLRTKVVNKKKLTLKTITKVKEELNLMTKLKHKTCIANSNT